MAITFTSPEAITLDQFRAEVGVEPISGQDATEQKRLERLFTMACRLVRDRTIADTPTELSNQAIVMLGGYIYARRNVGETPPSFPYAWTNSGCQWILRDYLKKPTALIEAV